MTTSTFISFLKANMVLFKCSFARNSNSEARGVHLCPFLVEKFEWLHGGVLIADTAVLSFMLVVMVGRCRLSCHNRLRICEDSAWGRDTGLLSRLCRLPLSHVFFSHLFLIVSYSETPLIG